MLIWEELRTELRKLRGRNLFRGNETHLWHQNQIRIPFELRASRESKSEIVIYVGDSWTQCKAELLPSKKEILISSYENDWKLWLHAIIEICRDGAYMHTNSKTAEYRKSHI